MEFVRKNHAIQCVRCYQHQGREVSEVVVSFDEQLDTIAPHVTAALSTQELNQLRAWLDERQQLRHELKDKPLGITVLEALPGLIQEATEAAQCLDRIDISLHQDIEQSLRLLKTALNDALHTPPADESQEFDSMQHQEVLKEQLTSIKSKV